MLASLCTGKGNQLILVLKLLLHFRSWGYCNQSHLPWKELNLPASFALEQREQRFGSTSTSRLKHADL